MVLDFVLRDVEWQHNKLLQMFKFMEFIDPSDQKEQYYITIQKIKDLCGGRHYPLLARSIIIIFRYDELNQTSCSGCCIFMGNPKVCLNKLKNIMSVFNQPNRQHENNQS